MTPLQRKIMKRLRRTYPARYTAGQLSIDMDEWLDSVRAALICLVKNDEINGHEQYGKIVFYAKELT